MSGDAWAALRDYRRREHRLIVGLMTGTSADGVDAALVEFSGPADSERPRLRAFRETPLEEELRREILEVSAAESVTPERLMALDAALGERYAVAVRNLIDEAGVKPGSVDAVGSHGQTVRHQPRAAGKPARTLQLGSAAVLADRTGIAVVSDFRSRDTAAGGEGAPLVPIADAWAFRSADESRVLLNLGGMANLTWLPRGRGDEGVVAFDTGPGNAVLDALAALRSGGRERLDAGGAFAATGTVAAPLLKALLADPFFDQPPPRSTGRERFGAAFAERLADRAAALGLSPADAARTAVELTAASVDEAIERHVRPLGPVDAVYASGGGVANATLMAALERRLAPSRVRSIAELGVPPAAKEAMAFAMLTHLTLCGLPGNLPAATGAARRVVLGHVTPGAWT
jgi:anhydro-N-acetylmuramic acid kinase